MTNSRTLILKDIADAMTLILTDVTNALAMISTAKTLNSLPASRV